MTGLPQWARREAHRFFAGYGIKPYRTHISALARVLVEAHKQGLRDAAAIVKPYFTMPVIDAELECDARRIYRQIETLIEEPQP